MCDTWMHGPCVKVTKRFSTGIDDYYCPRCRPVSPPSVANQSPNILTKTKPDSNTKKQDTKPTSKSGSPSTKRRKTKTSCASTTSDAGLTLESSLFSRPPAVVRIVQKSKLLELSDEVLVWILIWVHCQKSICRVSSTCKRLWSVAQDPYLVSKKWQNRNFCCFN